MPIWNGVFPIDIAFFVARRAETQQAIFSVLPQPLDQNHQNQQRKHKLEVGLHPSGDF